MRRLCVLQEIRLVNKLPTTKIVVVNKTTNVPHWFHPYVKLGAIAESWVLISIFTTQTIAMSEITITSPEWARLKLKVQRKYNHLTAEDLAFEPGQEEKLITHLMDRVKRSREYVVFTLKKGLANIDTNRL